MAFYGGGGQKSSGGSVFFWRMVGRVAPILKPGIEIRAFFY
jgi:hypothetical protein